MRAAGTIKVGTRKAQKFGTESLDERDWTGGAFENIRRCSENKRQWWLQDMGQADGKKSRRRAWSSQVKGEAKQTTLGVNPNAPLACSSQSKQTSSPTTAQSKPLSRWSPTCDLQLQSRLKLKFQHVHSIQFGTFIPVKRAWVGHDSRRGATPSLSPRELSGHADRSHSKNSLLTRMSTQTSKFSVSLFMLWLHWGDDRSSEPKVCTALSTTRACHRRLVVACSSQLARPRSL